MNAHKDVKPGYRSGQVDTDFPLWKEDGKGRGGEDTGCTDVVAVVISASRNSHIPHY